MHDLHSNAPFFDKPPETMYKYTSSTRALEILMNNKIYFAKSLEFNDPFDGQITLDIDTPEKRIIFIENLERKHRIIIPIKEKQEFINNSSGADELARAIVNKWQEANSTGICCLTNTCQSLPMWAHYANNHTGCCLVFDFSKYPNQATEEDTFPFHHMKKVEYRENLPTYNMGRPWHDYFYKSNEWQYEHEWRAIMFNKDVSLKSLNPFLRQKSHGTGLYSLGDFLCGIILGNKMMDVHKKSIKIAARQRRISVQQASPKLYKYGIHLTDVDSNRA